MTREETAAYCRAHGLTWREDSSNPTSARGLIRDTILPALRQLHPAAEANILATLEQLRDEAEVLDALVDAALPATLVSASRRSRRCRRRSQRLVLQRLAGEATSHRRARRRDRRALARPGRRRSTCPEVCAPSPSTAASGSSRPRDRGADASALPIPGPGRVRRRRAGVRAGTVRDRRRDARRGRARAHARGPRLAAGGPDAPARPGRHEVAAGPVHRPQGPARARGTGCPWWSPTGRSRGCRAWRRASGFASDRKPAARVRLAWRLDSAAP